MKQSQPKTAQPKNNLLDEVEWRRLKKLNCFEEEARQQGYLIIAGVDEAGRGPLAGPVVAAACIIPPDILIKGIDDSKKLPANKRKDLFEILVSDTRITYAIGLLDHQEIDRINILQATIQAMLIAIEALQRRPDYLLVDGLKLPEFSIPSQKIIKGDSLSQSIAAASILAKETRDRIMCEYHTKWPQYGFNKHKGYGTAQHLKALEEHGPCPIHRLSYEPLKGERAGFINL